MRRPTVVSEANTSGPREIIEKEQVFGHIGVGIGLPRGEREKPWPALWSFAVP
jgi:hypothetical protein